MSESSDSDEFYDAQDDNISLNKTIRRSQTLKKENQLPPAIELIKDTPISEEQIVVKNVVQGRRRFNELRKKMQTEDDDGVLTTNSTPESQNSSVDGIYAANKNTHPFKIIEHDSVSIQSMASLGKVGRILSGNNESSLNKCEATLRESQSEEAADVPPLPMQEPDVIASTKANSLKHSRNFDQAIVTMTNIKPQEEQIVQPVAPPRRKKKLKQCDGDNISVATTSSLTYAPSRPSQIYYDPNFKSSQALPSPASAIESLTRELQCSFTNSENNLSKESGTKKSSNSLLEKLCEKVSSKSNSMSTSSIKTVSAPSSKANSLDMKLAMRGGYVVKSAEDPVMRTHSEERAALGSHSGDMEKQAVATRRRSAGDSDTLLSDLQVLEQVTVLNLDTGERMPLSVAEDRIPQCINPLCLHIMRLTSQYSQPGDERQDRETDEESVCAEEVPPAAPQPTKTSAIKLKRLIGSTVKRTVDAAKSLAAEVTHARHKEDVGDIVDDVRGEHNIKLKASHSHKGPYEFEGTVRHVQEMNGQHTGAVWCMKFSTCGQLLATAGQDKILRIWVLREAAQYFQDMRKIYNAEQKSSPTPSQESLKSLMAERRPPTPEDSPSPAAPFNPKPLTCYIAHTSDLLDVSWSKNYFILSSSMDKTVRLWHISRNECLCCFQHIDFVTAIAFHPRDDRYFLSGSLDGKLRLWDIPDKKVAVWNEVDGQTKLITAANFCQNGKFAVVGTYDGRCILYKTDQLKYHTSIEVRSTRGKNSTGRKISGIEPMPKEDKILVTSNDSRVRLYDLRDLSLSCKYKGYVNTSSQIKASFSHDCKYIVSGSENQCIYIWRTHHDYSKFTSVRRDRNDFWEGIKAHNAVVTCAVFAPNPDHIIRASLEREEEARGKSLEVDGSTQQERSNSSPQRHHCTGHVLVSADFNGCIKVFVSKSKPKHSSLPASALN